MFNRLKLYFSNKLQKKWLAKILGWFANSKLGLFTTLMINIFIWFYKIDMSEAVKINSNEYLTFNSFFIRLLKPNLRPIDFDPNVITMPADGTITQMGSIKGNNLLQAKDHYYTVNALLAGDKNMSSKFFNGDFVTIYLAPNNYHRVHMPCNGVLREMIYVPGNLHSVNAVNRNRIHNLFSSNERIICYFDTHIGPFVQIMVGAIIVGSIETVWAGNIIPPHGSIIKRWYYPDSNNKNAIILLKGQEMGLFKLGSTVINLFTKKRIKIITELEHETTVCVGQPLAIKLPLFSKYIK
ncbi:archaetidylserine decarboxylase [Candidatus Pantoea edessiphila]|uniref:Phosphatidylserine decarboxylase proenzyme n=1 Tax=Candidatus Pantoea edessiphila TaxID=2044610 RepID=A0A2P5SVS7_9GAMM|nr:archaetidylserine decarboxylase [Candidatus Pantoea edessiphila]PPI86438.1 phosphatidylserine decarboxylase [Candidatus Pantoea edessiphila]